MLVAQSCLTLCNPMDCSPPGSSVHGFLQARMLSGLPFPSPGESSRPRDWTCISCISCTAGRLFMHWATREAWGLEKVYGKAPGTVKLWAALLGQGMQADGCTVALEIWFACIKKKKKNLESLYMDEIWDLHQALFTVFLLAKLDSCLESWNFISKGEREKGGERWNLPGYVMRTIWSVKVRTGPSGGPQGIFGRGTGESL